MTTLVKDGEELANVREALEDAKTIAAAYRVAIANNEQLTGIRVEIRPYRPHGCADNRWAVWLVREGKPQ